MNGAPAKPSNAARSPSASFVRRSASMTYGVASRAGTRERRSTSAADLIGAAMTGPTPGRISNGTPMQANGSMMSAKSTAASTPRRSTGISVAWAASSGVVATVMKSWRSRNARYSGNERPAWRMNQTGVVSTGFIWAAARKRCRPVIGIVPGDDLRTAVETVTS